MIVDKDGNMFDNRRKGRQDRRISETDKTGGRRKEDRRKAPEQLKITGLRKTNR